MTAQMECLKDLENELLRIAELLYEENQGKGDFDPVSQVNGYIQAHFTESTVTVDGIARDLNFNTSYLCAVYKKKPGRQSMPRSRKRIERAW